MPVLGWCWKFSEFVFLERSFEKDKEVIRQQVTELAEHPDPMWVSWYYPIYVGIVEPWNCIFNLSPFFAFVKGQGYISVMNFFYGDKIYFLYLQLINFYFHSSSYSLKELDSLRKSTKPLRNSLGRRICPSWNITCNPARGVSSPVYRPWKEKSLPYTISSWLSTRAMPVNRP